MSIVYCNFTPDQLQAQYSARAAVPGHPAIFKRWQERSEIYRSQAKQLLDIPYGESAREKLDLFLPDREKPPVLFFIHGGYWQAMDKSFFSFLARELVAEGIAVAIINYDLCPDVTLDTIAEQARRATAWLWSHAGDYGLDRGRLHLCGHSAGGQLTAMLMTARWQEIAGGLPDNLVKSGLSISGLFDLEPLVHTAINNALGLDLESARRNSPIYLAPVTSAPLVLAVGGEESSEFQRQSREFAECWSIKGVETSVLELPGLNHFTMVEQLATPGSAILDQALKLVSGQDVDSTRPEGLYGHW